MWKTADLTVVQKTIMDTLNKESKPQKVTFETVGSLQSTVLKRIIEMLTGRKKMHQPHFQSSVDCHNPNIKPVLNQRLHQKHFNWAKEKVLGLVAQCPYCISEESKCCRVWGKSGEAQTPKYLKSRGEVSADYNDFRCHGIC